MSNRSPNWVDEHVGKQIHAVRVEKGLSLEDLAGLLDEISYQQLRGYEVGKNRVACRRLYDICKVLKVPYERILPKMD